MRKTKKSFDKYIKDMFGDTYQDVTYENGLDKNGNPNCTRVTLYYKDGTHVGTWSAGYGKYFDK